MANRRGEARGEERGSLQTITNHYKYSHYPVSEFSSLRSALVVRCNDARGQTLACLLSEGKGAKEEIAATAPRLDSRTSFVTRIERRVRLHRPKCGISWSDMAHLQGELELHCAMPALVLAVHQPVSQLAARTVAVVWSRWGREAAARTFRLFTKQRGRRSVGAPC